MERLRPHSRLLPMRVPVVRPRGPRPRRSPRLGSAQEAPVSDARHQKKQYAQPDLHPLSEARWIDHLDQVVRDESAAVAGLSGTLAQAVLQQRQRAGEAGELDHDAVNTAGMCAQMISGHRQVRKTPPTMKLMNSRWTTTTNSAPARYHISSPCRRSFPTNTIC